MAWGNLIERDEMDCVSALDILISLSQPCYLHPQRWRTIWYSSWSRCGYRHMVCLGDCGGRNTGVNAWDLGGVAGGV